MNQVNFNLLKGSLSRKKQAAGPADRQAPTQQEVEELFTGRITPETVLPPMQPLFEMFGVPCFYRGELVADCGKAKSGKTFFLSILMAACLTEKVLALERHTDNKGHTDIHCHTDLTDLTDFKPLRVLWVDTEQSQQSTQDILVNRIIPLIANGHTDSTDLTDLSSTPTSGDSQKSVKSERSVCDIDSSLFAFNLLTSAVLTFPRG